jgi:hypothetical protein
VAIILAPFSTMAFIEAALIHARLKAAENFYVNAAGSAKDRRELLNIGRFVTTLSLIAES